MSHKQLEISFDNLTKQSIVNLFMSFVMKTAQDTFFHTTGMKPTHDQVVNIIEGILNGILTDNPEYVELEDGTLEEAINAAPEISSDQASTITAMVMIDNKTITLDAQDKDFIANMRFLERTTGLPTKIVDETIADYFVSKYPPVNAKQ